MLSSVYAEDIFINFHDRVIMLNLSIQQQDYSPILSFGQKIYANEQLTQNQANYIVKILEKYKNVSANAGYDYTSLLSNLQWKQSFRVLDLTKKIYVELAEDKVPIVCLKFPYQLKKEFDDEIDNKDGSVSSWNSSEKVRKISLYNCNLIQLYEFVKKHNFDIDETFMCALSDVEEIWQNSDELIPKSMIVDGQIILENAGESAVEFFQKNMSGILFDDALLAKSMGYPVDIESVPLHKSKALIVSSNQNSFWVKDNHLFFELYKSITGKICIVLDRTGNTLNWLQKFVADADACGIDREEIKVCFRESKEGSTGLNEWIKLAGVGGKVESGRILIFEYKPAKWLFKDINDVKMLVTNNLYPPTTSLARDFFNSHPCVIYLGDIKPSEQRGQKIVEL